jgi:hypothetical protein
MPRPRCCRMIAGLPGCELFKPAGIPGLMLEQIVLSLDELEALRLADLEGPTTNRPPSGWASRARPSAEPWRRRAERWPRPWLGAKHFGSKEEQSKWPTCEPFSAPTAGTPGRLPMARRGPANARSARAPTCTGRRATAPGAAAALSAPAGAGTATVAAVRRRGAGAPRVPLEGSRPPIALVCPGPARRELRRARGPVPVCAQ